MASLLSLLRILQGCIPIGFLNYGDKTYFDPGNKEVQQYVTNVVADVVNRYDVDAIHFDDYFYPYRIAGKEFPDDAKIPAIWQWHE
ncbi:MAG: family 10 glycosylhydrolase [Ferruginibacter sp.]